LRSRAASRILNSDEDGVEMKHYRINKLAKPGGMVVKTKDVLAQNDEQAVDRARHDDDCPVCEVLQAGKPVGAVLSD
jgi:hypothetical protein